jgi:formylglycine-generating enzyme required for sulfatase activity
MNKRFRILSLTLLLFTGIYANNVQIGPVTILGTDTLQFTISWENSWRVTNNPNNWDAVWVFVKRSDCASIQWHHANLSSQDADHSASTLLFVDAYADKKGVMIYRSAPGFGNTGNVTIKLKLDAPPLGNYQYKVFGVEMVYVPEGAFYAGDGASTQKFKIGNTDSSFLITGEAPLLVSPVGSNLWTLSNTVGPFTLPAAYPKGYNAFYCMKYEISQGQYADFLNTIASDAAQNRYDQTLNNNSRYTISGAWPSITAAAYDRACNHLSIDDLIAFDDWAALSPLTELEFEKACRGNSINVSVAGEFAWGTNAVTSTTSITPGTDGQSNETVDDVIAPGSGLANYLGTNIIGPLRCGFAARTATSRLEAGASYYGLMEMSGNLYELCYNVDTTVFGRSYLFNGTHGDGELSVSPNPGYANQSWPGELPLDLTTQYFSFAAKGGSWVSQADQLKVSDRNANIITSSVPQPNSQGRSPAFGGRGVSRRQ